MANLQQSYASLSNEVRASAKETAHTLHSLSATVESGLNKLSTNTGSTTAHDDIKTRLSALEASIAEIKKAVAAVAAAQTAQAKQPPPPPPQQQQSSEPLLKEIRAVQNQILERLNNATSQWTFDHEALLESTKNSSLAFYNFLQRWSGEVVEQAGPMSQQAWKTAQEYSTIGMEHATHYGNRAQRLLYQLHTRLTDELLKHQAVPAEHVASIALGIIGAVLFIALLITLVILKAMFRACCGKKKQQQRQQ